MIGLIQCTGPEGDSVYLNPIQISWFTKMNAAYAATYAIPPERMVKNGSIITVAGQTFQVQESPSEIVGSLSRLRVLMENNAIKVRKKAEEEPWQQDDFPGEEKDD